MEETSNYIIPAFFSGGGAVVNYVIVNGFASELVREIIANALWSILSLGLFITGLAALGVHLTTEYETNGTIASIPLGLFGQTVFPLIVLFLETFKYPNFGANYIIAILTDYLMFHFVVGAFVWIGVLYLRGIL